MNTKRRSKTRVFESAAGRYEVATGEWGEVLLFLEDRGWQPEQLRINYLGTDVNVSDADARNMAKVGQHVLDATLTDPFSVYPVRFDMGKFYELTEFCKAGGFRICR